MIIRLLSFVALLAFVALPLGKSEEVKLILWNVICICSDYKCKNPVTPTYANVTRGVMKMFHNGVMDVNTTDYACSITNYSSNGTEVLNVRGCVMTGAFDCGLQLKNQTWKKDTCKLCKTNKCNVPNSVGSYTSKLVIAMALFIGTKEIQLKRFE